MDSSAHPHAPRPPSTDDNNSAFQHDIYNGYSFSNPIDPQYNFSWDDQIFQTNQDSQPVYAPPNSTWTSPPQPNVVEPEPPQYGFNHAFENHTFAQPSHDPRLQPQVQNPPYQHYSYNPTISYPGQNFSNQYPSQSPSPYPQQRTSVQHVGYSPQPMAQQYLRYTPSPGAHPNLQSFNMEAMPGFAEHGHMSQFGQHTIDPQFLTANDAPAMPPQNYQGQSQSNHSSLHYNFDVSSIPPGTLPPSALAPQHQRRDLPQLAQNGILVPAKAPKPTIARSRKKKDPTVKAPRGRPRKDASQAPTEHKGSASSETDSSDYESEGDSQMPPAEPKPRLLDLPRPDNPELQAEWDAARSVWSPRNRPAIEEGILQGVTLFAKMAKGIRDTWKTKNDALKDAEAKKLGPDVPRLQHDVGQQRRLIEIATKSALDHGHSSYLARLGENPFTMIALQSFLLDRNSAGDNDGLTTLSILKLVSKFITLDQDMLEKTKSDKILARLSKKAGDEVKALAQKILGNVVAATKRKKEQTQQPVKVDSVQSPLNTSGSPSSSTEPKRFVPQVVIHNAKKVDPVAGAKRPREQENGNLPAAKKAVGIITTKAPTVSKPPLALTANLKRPQTVSPDGKEVRSTSNATGLKAKNNIAAPKPGPTIFQTLASASKKPGTSNAARAAAAKEKASVAFVEKKEIVTTPTATAPAPAAIVAKPSFSFAETLANLHKPKEVETKKVVDDRPTETEEERRKRLRKEERRKLRVTWRPEESLAEIRLFVHDPEEVVSTGDSSMRDMGDVGGEGRMLKMHKDLDDLEEEEENHAGRPEELAPYTMLSDVDFSEIDQDEKDRNFSKRGGLQIAQSPEKAAQDQREATTLMVVYALPTDVPSTPKEPPAIEDEYDPELTIAPFGEPDADKNIRAREAKYFASQASKQAPQADLTSLLSMIKPQQQQTQAQPLSDLERTFNLFRQQGQAQPVQQAPLTAGGVDLSKILGVMKAQQQMQVPQPQPQAPQPTSNLAALLAQFSGQAQGQNGVAGGQSFSFGQHNQDEQDDRKHDRMDYDDYGNGTKRKKVGPTTNPNTLLGKKHPKAGSVACRFWKEGLCKKGDECTFRHDD